MIVALGDSITYGQHLADPSQAWPKLLRGRVVISAGVPGETTRIGLERFPKIVQEVEPDAVVIQYGHNDCNRWDSDRGLPRVSAGAFEANIEEMFVRARAFNIKPLVCTLTPSFRSEQHANDCHHYNQIIRGLAALHEVPLIDVRGAFDGMNVSAPIFLMADGLHLTERGHQVYAQVVQNALDRERIF